MLAPSCGLKPLYEGSPIRVSSSRAMRSDSGTFSTFCLASWLARLISIDPSRTWSKNSDKASNFKLPERTMRIKSQH